MSNNKRKNSRVALDIYLNKYVAGVPYMTRTSDISREGVGLAHLLEPQLAGKRVGLQFQLPGSEEVIYAEGEVVREWADLDNREGLLRSGEQCVHLQCPTLVAERPFVMDLVVPAVSQEVAP